MNPAVFRSFVSCSQHEMVQNQDLTSNLLSGNFRGPVLVCLRARHLWQPWAAVENLPLLHLRDSWTVLCQYRKFGGIVSDYISR